jgi:hypothetical protein
MKKSEYEIITHKASSFDKMARCIYIESNSTHKYATDKNNHRLMCFETDREYVVTVKIKEMIESMGITFEYPIKFNVIQ